MSCGCNNWMYNLPCCCPPTPAGTTTTSTTTLCPNGEPCEEAYQSDCVIFTGEGNTCYGLQSGMSVTDILQVLINQLPPCGSTTTSTTSTTTLNPCAICTGFAATPTIACLYGLKIEFLYIATNPDLALLPAGYVHPCPDAIATHNCDRALHEIYMAGHYVGDALMNNATGSCGAVTEYGTPVCKDFENTPAPITGGVWTGTRFSRYSAIVIDMEEAIEIAAANGNSSLITFDFQHALSKYGSECQGTTQAHDHEIWVRITKPDGTVIYNDCQTTGTFTVDVCSEIPYTTTTTSTTTLLPPTTTTTTLICSACSYYAVHNITASPLWVSYRECGTNIPNNLYLAPGDTENICACNNSITTPISGSIVITNLGVCP